MSHEVLVLSAIRRGSPSLRRVPEDPPPKYLPLTKNYRTLVDPIDYESYKHLKWYADIRRPGYIYAANGCSHCTNGKRFLHRLITNAPKGCLVDHANGDTLDNRRGNLRLCSASQNAQNKRGMKNHTSRFKGVCLYRRRGRVRTYWRASIKPPNKRGRITLGNFHTEEEAAWAYQKAAKQLFGAFAYAGD